MSIWRVKGGAPLEGSLTIQGACGAALPVLAACVLAGAETELTNVPALWDVETALDILARLGCAVRRQDDVVSVDSRGMTGWTIPCEAGIRPAICFFGPVLACCGRARIAIPACGEFGSRPLEGYLAPLEALGAKVEMEGGAVLCTAPDGLTGGHIALERPSVGATASAMTAACAARGETVITGAACEPEIVHLQGFLRALGAAVDGAGTAVIRIRGGHLASRPVGWRVMPDPVAAATVLCACASAGGDVELRGLEPESLGAVADTLAAMGAMIARGDRRMRIRCAGRLRGGGTVIGGPWPAVPAGALPLLMAAGLKAEGTTVLAESTFSDRFRAAEEMRLLGADVRREGRVAVVTGVERLTGAPVLAEDTRGGASLILAGLGAEGTTAVTDHGHIARGYEGLDRALNGLGAHIEISE